MITNDPVGDGQTEPDTASLMPGGKKWFDYLRPYVRRDTDALSGYLQLQLPVMIAHRVTGCRKNHAAGTVRQRMESVQQQIEHHLQNLPGAAGESGKILGEVKSEMLRMCENP